MDDLEGPESGNSSEVPEIDIGELLTVAEVAGILRLSKMSVYRLIHTGEIPSYRFGRAYRIPLKWLEDFKEASKMQ